MSRRIRCIAGYDEANRRFDENLKKHAAKEQHGVECERCGGLAENIECMYGEYWLCQKCAKAHRVIAIRARLLNEFWKKNGNL